MKSSAYYNENDPCAAAWLRELIRENLIADGDVDERSIADIRPVELRGYTQCHFFAGIGGWSKALRLSGWRDDRAVWTGSCPCQPFSAAGKGGGLTDERHLWPAWFHLIQQCRPAVIFGEQVASPAGLTWFDVVSSDLEASLYACEAVDLCAAGVGAPHIRQRLYFVADANGGNASSQRQQRGGQHGQQPQDCRPSRLEHTEGDGREQRRSESSGRGTLGRCGESNSSLWDSCDWIECTDGKARPVEPGTFPLAHGVFGRVGLLRGYGNAIVPQVAQAFIEAYLNA